MPLLLLSSYYMSYIDCYFIGYILLLDYSEPSICVLASLAQRHSIFYSPLFLHSSPLSAIGPTLLNYSSHYSSELKTTHIPLETFKSKLKTYLFTIAYDQLSFCNLSKFLMLTWF